MRFAFLLPVATILASCFAFASDAHALELPELTARTRPSVVLLTVYGPTGAKEGTGTGFFVSGGGRIMTNHHVIAAASRIEATLDSGKIVPIAGVVADDAARDLAIVQTSAGEGYPALSFAKETLRQGDEIIVLGSPHGFSGSLSVGIVSAVRDKFVGEAGEPFSTAHWRVQITAAISAGSSGSPVMNRAGEIVAVAVGTRATAQNLNFAIPGETARAVLEGVPANAPLVPLSTQVTSPVKRNLIISGGVVAGLALLAFIVLRLDGRKPPPPTKKPKPSGLPSLSPSGAGASRTAPRPTRASSHLGAHSIGAGGVVISWRLEPPGYW